MFRRVRRVVRVGISGQVDPGDERFQREAQRDLNGIIRNFDISDGRSDFVRNARLAQAKQENRNGGKQEL